MDSIFPIVTVTDLQRSTKSVLDDLHDYAVVQNHGKDVAMLLHPDVGRALMQSDAFRELLAQCSTKADTSAEGPVDFRMLDSLIGEVLRELSKK